MTQVPPLTPVSICRCNPLSFLLQLLLREPCILLRELLHTSLKCCFMTSHLLQASNFLRELSRVLHVPLQASIFLRKARVDTSDLLRNGLLVRQAPRERRTLTLHASAHVAGKGVGEGRCGRSLRWTAFKALAQQGGGGGVLRHLRCALLVAHGP